MSNLILKIIEPAELELDDAFQYYENALYGLGSRFINSFRHAIHRIVSHPAAWACVQDNLRKCRLDKFPFDIIYAIEDNFIIIITVSHHHRKPYYWIDRLEK